MAQCEYCMFDKDGFPKAKFPTKENTLSALNGQLKVDDYGKGDVRLQVSICTPFKDVVQTWKLKYCPMCGRNLEK